MTSEVDNLPKILDLIHIIICNVFLTSWTFAINQMLFYHRPDSMLVLEINTITWVQFWVSCEFLYYKAQTGWPQENLFKNKNYNHIQVTIDITKWDPLTWPVNACSDPGHKFEFSSITEAQSEQQAKFQKRRKIFHNYIYIGNTRLW